MGWVRVGWGQMPIPPALRTLGIQQKSRGLPKEGPPPPTPCKGTPDKGSPPPHHPHRASAGECSHWRGPHSIWEPAICRLSPSAGCGSGGGRDVEAASTGGLAGAYLSPRGLSLSAVGTYGWAPLGHWAHPLSSVAPERHTMPLPPHILRRRTAGSRAEGEKLLCLPGALTHLVAQMMGMR